MGGDEFAIAVTYVRLTISLVQHKTHFFSTGSAVYLQMMEYCFMFTKLGTL